MRFRNAQGFTDSLRQKLAEGVSLDLALEHLRASGATIGQCVFAVTFARKCRSTEAKRLVYSSPAWADEVETMQKKNAKLLVGLGAAFLVIALFPPVGFRTVLFGFAGSFHLFNYLRLRQKFAADKKSGRQSSS